MKQSTDKIVVLIISAIKGGGAERSVLTLGQGFHELGYKVHILRFKSLTEYDLNPNLVYHLLKFKPYKLIPNERFRHKLFARAIDNFIEKKIGKPDIVLSNLEPSDRVMVYSKLPNIMYIIRNNISNKFKLTDSNKLENKISKLQHIYRKHPCVCVSKGVENDLQARLGPHITSTTIYNPFDKQLIKQMSNESYSTPHSVLKPNQYIVHVGSFTYQKAHDVLLKAYAQSSMAYPLVLLGKGKIFDETKALAKSLGIDDKIIFLGFNKNPYPYMKNARGLVLSSRFEGFVRVIPEALTLDTPVISTDCPSGPSEMLPASSLVPVDDIDALAIKITELMADPQFFRVGLDESFLPKNIAQQYIDYSTS